MKLDNRDVGLAEDMIFALKNLIAIENHAAVSYGIGKNKKFFQLIDIIRRLRTKWIGLLVKKENSHLWCISKHLLASAEGMLEIGNRFTSTNQENEASEAYEDANTLISLFLILNEIGGDHDTEQVQSSA